MIVLKWIAFIIITFVMWQFYFKFITIDTKEFSREKRLDERALRMRLEVLSRTFGFMFLIIMSYIALKISGLKGDANNVFTENLEIVFLVVLLVNYCINIIMVNKKYNWKRENNEK